MNLLSPTPTTKFYLFNPMKRSRPKFLNKNLVYATATFVTTEIASTEARGIENCVELGLPIPRKNFAPRGMAGNIIFSPGNSPGTVTIVNLGMKIEKRTV